MTNVADKVDDFKTEAKRERKDEVKTKKAEEEQRKSRTKEAGMADTDTDDNTDKEGQFFPTSSTDEGENDAVGGGKDRAGSGCTDRGINRDQHDNEDRARDLKGTYVYWPKMFEGLIVGTPRMLSSSSLCPWCSLRCALSFLRHVPSTDSSASSSCNVAATSKTMSSKKSSSLSSILGLVDEEEEEAKSVQLPDRLMTTIVIIGGGKAVSP